MDENDDQIIDRVIVKVHLVSGLTKEHCYNMLDDSNDTKTLKKILNTVTLLYKRDSRLSIRPAIIFDNPHVYYNADNIVYIEIEGITEEEMREIEEMTKKKSVKMGFKK